MNKITQKVKRAEGTKKQTEFLILGMLLLITTVYYLFFIDKGLTLYDEGYLLESSYLTYLGKVPYKDFFFQYTPLTAWLGAMWFRVFGVGLLNLRWLALVFSVGTTLLGYLIIKRVLPIWLSIFATTTLAIWGFPHANFFWPSAVALFFLFLIIYLLFRFVETKKELFIFLAGLAVALSILTKQNLGLVNFISANLILFYLWIKEHQEFALRWFYIGISTLILPAIGYLFVKGAMPGLAELLRRSLIMGKGQAFYFPYTIFDSLEPGITGLAKTSGKLFLYDFPLLVFLFGAILSIKKWTNLNIFWRIVFFLSSLHFFAVVWPSADLAHLTFGVPAAVLMSAVYLGFKNRIIKFLAFTSLTIFFLIGIYKTFYMPYFTFETPYKGQNTPVNIRGETIYTDKKHKTIIEGLNEFNSSLEKDEEVFVHPYATMIYYVLDKNPPVYDLYTVGSLLSESAEKKTVTTLKEKRVDWIIYETWRGNLNTSIGKLIKNNYTLKYNYWDIEVLILNQK